MFLPPCVRFVENSERVIQSRLTDKLMLKMLSTVCYQKIVDWLIAEKVFFTVCYQNNVC